MYCIFISGMYTHTVPQSARAARNRATLTLRTGRADRTCLLLAYDCYYTIII